MIEKHDREAERREAERAVDEAGGGEAEGFEMAEKALRRHAEGVDEGGDPLEDAAPVEAEETDAVFGEADHEHSSERPESDHD
jgi:hypothetical protein